MKKFVVILFSVFIVLINAQFGLQMAIYQAFKPELIEKYCVNKNNPDADCEARCHMKKSLDKENTQKNGTTEISFKLAEFYSSTSVAAIIASPVKILFQSESNTPYLFSPITVNLLPAIQPPRA